jgi:archaeal flagellar protein FlaJ
MEQNNQSHGKGISFLTPLKENPKYIFLIVGMLIIGAGGFLFSKDVGVLGNLVLISLILVTLPYFLVSYFEYLKIREMEDNFPSFLRDVADSVRSGSILPDAIKAASNVEYGRLTPEVQKFANQLSWGVSFPRATELFIKRMRKSELISKSSRIMLEAYKAGGNIAPVMESIADSVVLIKETEYERAAALREQVVMMYAIYFIFLGIIMALTGILLPILEVSGSVGSTSTLGGGGLSGGNPCDLCIGFQCGVCDGLTGLGKAMGFGSGGLESYYKGLFFAMVLIQGLFSGLVAGQIGEDSMVAGIRHGLIMMGAGFGIFVIASRLGFI